MGEGGTGECEHGGGGKRGSAREGTGVSMGEGGTGECEHGGGGKRV